MWDFFFNIFLPAGHPINGNHIPDEFSPLIPYSPIDVFHHDFEAGDYVSSTSVRARNPDIHPGDFPRGELLFSCQGPIGAVLAQPYGSHLEKLENIEDMRRYAARNAESWYRYINGARGRRLANGGLYLISGCEKSHAGGMATFQNVAAGDNFHLSLKPTTDSDAGHKYRFNRGTPALTKTFSSPMQGDDHPLNHTTFLHGFTITLGEGIWGKLFGNVGISQITDCPFQKAHAGSYVPFGSQGSIFSFAFNLFTGARGTGGKQYTSTNQDEVTISGLSPTPKIIHPSQKINEFILREVPHAAVVITHDDDWRDILLDDGTQNTVSNASVFRSKLLQRFQILEEDGIVYLKTKSESTPTGISSTGIADKVTDRDMLLATPEAPKIQNAPSCRGGIGISDDLAFTLTLEIAHLIQNVRGNKSDLNKLNNRCKALLIGLSEASSDLEDRTNADFLNEMESILHGIREKLENIKSVNILSSVFHHGEMRGWIDTQHRKIEDAFRTMTTKFLVAQANQIGESRAMQALDVEDMRSQLTELLAVFLRSHFNSEAPLDLKPVGEAINIISAPGSHTTTFTESYTSSSSADFRLPPIAGPSRPPSLPLVAGSSRTIFTLEDILAPNPSTAKASAPEVVSPQPVLPICRKVDGKVVSGNLLGLVDHLITDTDDQDFRKVMLDTYRAYATPEDVFAILKARFEEVQPKIGPHYYLTRFKIIEVIVAWIQTVPPESNLLRQVADFASTTRNRLVPAHQKKILKAVDDRSRKMNIGPPRQEFVPDEAHKLAVALTFIEIDIRKTARWSDYLLYEQGSKTTYIATMERENEKMIRWLRYSILRHEDIRDRARTIKLLAKTAQECRDMQNYNSMAAIATVLDWKAKPMTDLLRTTDRLSSHTRASIKVLAEAINPDENYKAYKDIECHGDRNRIPWLVVELLEVKELLSSKKYPSTVQHETNQLINFERYRQLAFKIPRYQIPPELETDRNAAHIAYLSNQFDSVEEIDPRRLKQQEEKDYRDRKHELKMLVLRRLNSGTSWRL